MPSIQKILVPVDFSPSSRAAFDLALFLADRLGASVDLLHLFRPPETARVVDAPTAAPSGLAEELHEFQEATARPEHVVVHERLEVGEPSKRIIEDAKAGGFDLIVIGTHGRTGRLHMIAGSVAEAVVRGAACPVLTVRESR